MKNKYKVDDALYAVKKVFPKSRKATKVNRGYSHDIFEIETGVYPEKVILIFSNDNHEKYSIKKQIRVNRILNNLGIPVPRVIHHDGSKKTSAL